MTSRTPPPDETDQGTLTVPVTSSAPPGAAARPSGETGRRRRRRMWAALAVTIVALTILGALVRYEVQQMSLIVNEVCAPPRTSWVPFLHNDLVACMGLATSSGATDAAATAPNGRS